MGVTWVDWLLSKDVEGVNTYEQWLKLKADQEKARKVKDAINTLEGAGHMVTRKEEVPDLLQGGMDVLKLLGKGQRDG